MNTRLVITEHLERLADAMAGMVEEQADGVLVSGFAPEMRLKDWSLLLDAPLPLLLELPDDCPSDRLLEDLEYWPDHLSLVVSGYPETIREVAEALFALGEEISETGEKAVDTDTSDVDDPMGEETSEAETSQSSGRRWPRLIPRIRAKHKEHVYTMNEERNLSGFTFYRPATAGLEGYEIVLPGIESEVLSHEERMQKYDLARWLGRYLAALDGIAEPVVLLHSETAEQRGEKGYDIEMSAYCRDRSGLPVIIAGGVGTVRHVLNYERFGKGAGMLLPASIYDGSFSLHDVRAFVDEEMAKLADRGSQLSLGVLGGGRLAGDSTGGSYWQKPSDETGDKTR